MRRTLLAATALAALSISAGAPVQADDTGMASMHEQRRVGGRRCFTDHSHYGSSSGERSRARALSAAIVSWREFTAFEYGTDWAHFGRAIGKSINCTGAGADWGCSIDATPCR